jgi:hypothetical protein
MGHSLEIALWEAPNRTPTLINFVEKGSYLFLSLEKQRIRKRLPMVVAIVACDAARLRGCLDGQNLGCRLARGTSEIKSECQD